VNPTSRANLPDLFGWKKFNFPGFVEFPQRLGYCGERIGYLTSFIFPSLVLQQVLVFIWMKHHLNLPNLFPLK
jgi:hypothetical protein